MTGVNSGIVKERKRGDNRVASVSAGQNLVGRLGRALDDGDLPMEKNNIWDARTEDFKADLRDAARTASSAGYSCTSCRWASWRVSSELLEAYVCVAGYA